MVGRTIPAALVVLVLASRGAPPEEARDDAPIPAGDVRDGLPAR